MQTSPTEVHATPTAKALQVSDNNNGSPDSNKVSHMDTTGAVVTFTKTRPESLGKLDVAIPEDAYEAGKIGTVRLIIRNSFDLPVDILEIQRPRSSYLTDIAEKSVSVCKQDGEASTDNAVSKFLRRSLSGATKVAVSGVSFAGMSAEFTPVQPEMNISAQKGSKVTVDRDFSRFHRVNIVAEQGSDVELVSQPTAVKPTPKQRIEPHCEIVAYFQVETNGWLLFKPTRMNLDTQIRYTVCGQERTQVVSCSLDVKPPLSSVVLGSLSGAFLGALARSLQPLTAGGLPKWSFEAFVVGTGSAMVLSLIATIALSRKSGAQGFITVEDFFGGFVIGTLIGYQGSGYFNKSILPQLEHAGGVVGVQTNLPPVTP